MLLCLGSTSIVGVQEREDSVRVEGQLFSPDIEGERLSHVSVFNVAPVMEACVVVGNARCSLPCS